MGKKSRKERRGAQERQAASADPGVAPVAAEVSNNAPLRALVPTPAELGPAGTLTPRARTLANAFIALFLVFQIVMPLRWYLGERSFDERFSWRMFSTIRMLDCDASVYEATRIDGMRRERPVDVADDVQIAWVKLLERFRALVVRKVLARRCEHEGIVSARFHLACKQPDGRALPDVDRHYVCADGVMREGAGEPAASVPQRRARRVRAREAGEP